MTVFGLHGVGVVWAASAPVFEEVQLTLSRGFYGLVGANGAGKSTLLALLAGEMTPHEGHVELRPRDALVVHCRQRVDALDDDVRSLAARDDAVAAELRGRFGLSVEGLRRWPTLSPGERKRWQVAAALAREPDVLLLDEPTNHLDREARRELIGALRRYSGLGVLVSHDRGLLSEVTTATLRIHRSRVALYEGAYAVARQQWQAERARAEQLHTIARQRVSDAAQRLDTLRRTQAATNRSISTRTRMKDKNDSDARSLLATTRAAWADSRAGRAVSLARSDLLRAREAVPPIERDVTLGSRLFASYQRAPNPVLFHLDCAQILAGEHAVLQEVRLSIERTARTRIEGRNGAGKTTLLRALVASVSRQERLLYLPQEVEPEAVSALSTRLRLCPPEEKGRWLSIFAALGSDPHRILASGAAQLSPGELRKLLLAEALARQVWGLVLDEPTNHLDLPSIERLEEALASYPGCVVLVTHDDAFATRLTSDTVLLDGGRVRAARTVS